MAETKIEWADYSFNPWVGCQKVSEGCANCYAERDFDKRRHYARWGPSGTRVKTSEANWNNPRAWNRKAEKEGVRFRVFCASLSDVFEDWQHAIRNHNDNLIFKKRNEIGEYVTSQSKFPSPPLSHVSMDDLRRDLFELIDETPYLDWLLVTKRPENILKMWPVHDSDDFVIQDSVYGDKDWSFDGYRNNVWLLTSIENQEQFSKRIPELLKCRELSPVLGLSCEPLLGPIEFSDSTNRSDAVSQLGKNALSGIDWVIAGGESGPNARPAHPDWICSLLEQCHNADVPFLFKQWGEWYPLRGTGIPCQEEDEEQEPYLCVDLAGNVHDAYQGIPSAVMIKLGKKESGRKIDGYEYGEFPRVNPNKER